MHMYRDAVRPEFRALDYFVQRFDAITSQVARTPSEQEAIDAAAEEVLDIICAEVHRLALDQRMSETKH